MPKSVGRSPTGSLVRSGGGVPRQISSPRTGTESTLKLKTGSKHFVDRSHDRVKIGSAKLSFQPPLYDESGVDVTPRPLEKRSFIDVPIKTTSALIGAMDTPSTLLDYPGRSKFVSVQRNSLISMLDSLMDDEITPAVVHTTRQEIQEEPTSQESLVPSNLPTNTLIQTILSETDTNYLFELEGLVIQADTEEAEIITKKNEAYKKLCIIKETSDSFTDRQSQTVTLPQKQKSIQTVSLDLKDVGSEINQWLMYDTYEEEAKFELDRDEKAGKSQASFSEDGDILIGEHSTESVMEIFRDSISEGTADSIMAHTPTVLSPLAGSRISKTSAIEEPKQPPIDANAAKSTALKNNLFIMERVINMNLFQTKLAAYKHFEVLEEPVYLTRKVEDSLFYDEEEVIEEKLPESPEIPETINIKRIVSVTHWEIKNAYSLVNLFSFFTPKLAGYAVNCIDIVPDYPDLIGIGYGDTEFTSNRSGFAACWSLKNLRFPERIIECKLGVTAISFSRTNPALLAVGLHDGTIMLGLVREQTNKWIMDSSDANELHIGPIWKLLWINRTQGLAEEKKEFLLSACEDAHICQWFLRKGMESVTLMRVKQTELQTHVKESTKADISVAKYATVFCIAFHPIRENIYLVGTGEGCIHQCSSTNSDHFNATYLGHTGPVNQVCWSPFVDYLFLSCSSDWSIRLWIANDSKKAVFFQHTPSIVITVCWSPVNSTIFAALHSSEVELWDLTFSTMDPVSVYALDMEIETEFSMLAFNHIGDALFVGDKTGRLTTLGLANFPTAPENPKEALIALVATCVVIEKHVDRVQPLEEQERTEGDDYEEEENNDDEDDDNYEYYDNDD